MFATGAGARGLVVVVDVVGVVEVGALVVEVGRAGRDTLRLNNRGPYFPDKSPASHTKGFCV